MKILPTRMKITKRKSNDVVDKVETPELIPASEGGSMNPFINWLNTYSTLRPKNIFEIGANMAQDAEALRQGFGLLDKDVWVFEPHPQLFEYIKKNYRFNAYANAVLDKDSAIKINAINLLKNSNSGISSVRTHKDVPENHFIKVDVPGIRMDTFIKHHSIKALDFVKLDVEGCNYEVLRGFGDKIKLVNAIHVEAEHIVHWEGERLWEDIRKLLEPHLEMVYFERHFTQSDSFWVKREFIKDKP